MTFSGDYAERASKTYKTIEGKRLLAAVREFLTLLDAEMKASFELERAKRVAKLANALDIEADCYDLFGEKDRRRKQP